MKKLTQGRRSCGVLLMAILIVVALSFIPSAATAATCSSYGNQAAAQRAADTRDADGDGIYCVISLR